MAPPAASVSSRSLTESPMIESPAAPSPGAVPRLPTGAPLERLALLAAVLALVPLAFTNAFHYDIATKIAINAILCVGLNLLVGYAGQISLGHAGFFGLGAYGTAILPGLTGLPPLPSAILTAACVGAFAALVARPILKLKGHYLAMATLGLGAIISIVLNREIGLTGGPDGLTVPALVLGGVKVRAIETWYWVAAAGLLLAVLLAENLIHSPAGRSLRAIHSSEIAAATSGIDVARGKARVFALSAVYASLAGSLFALAERFITPADASFLHSVEFLTMIVLGGLGSTYGALVGAGLLTALPQLFAAMAEYKNIAIGLVLVLTMVFLPKGIVPSLSDFVAHRLARRSPRP